MVSRLAVGAVAAYRVALSPLYLPTCRFYPTCSAYALEAYDIHGFWRATWLVASRLLRCHPFFPGGVDPVPAPHTGSEENPST